MNNQMISYSQILNIEKDYLQSSLLTHHEFKLLFNDVYGYDFNPVDASENDASLTKSLLEKLDKRKKGEPIQYIIGKWPFIDLELYVDDRALIPRPETEYLAQYAEEYAKHISNPIIVDLCAGCGAIALFLSKSLPSSTVYAVELSHDACQLMSKNKELINTGINIIEMDVLQYLSLLPNNSVDLFVSNPPYVKEDEYYTNYEELKYEPLVAFIAPDDGLFFYKHMTELCHAKQKTNGSIMYEIGEDQGEAVKDILIKCGYDDIVIKKDFNSLDRYVIGKKR